jgi:YVTN family beta-propeller protein
MLRGRPEATFEVPGAPDWIAVDESVWVSNKPKDSVARIDPKTNKVIETVTVGSNPCSGLASGFGSLWVPNCGDQTLSRVDLKTGKVTATIPIGIADSEGGACRRGRKHLDPDRQEGNPGPARSGDQQSRGRDPGAGGIVHRGLRGGRRLGDGHRDQRPDARRSGHEPDRRDDRGRQAPRFLAVGGGFVWTLNQAQGNVSKVDPKTNKVVETIEVGVPGPGGDIAFGEGSLWVTSFEFPISRNDPASGKVVQQFAGEGGDAIRVGLGSVWLSNLKAGTVWRLDPRRIEATVQ